MAFAFVVEDAADESVEGLLELRDLGNPTDDLILQLLPFRIFHLRRMQQQVACIPAGKIWLCGRSRPRRSGFKTAPFVAVIIRYAMTAMLRSRQML